MKKFSKLLIVGLFLTSFTGLASANFTDVSPTNPYADAIAYLQKNNIVQGYPDGTFRSNNFINRAEFTKILINATSGNTATPTDFSLSGLPFQDLEAYQWYIPYLRFALAHSVIQGYPDHTFRPQNEINFAEAAKMVVGAFGYSTSSIGSGPWYQPYVSVLSVKNAIPTTITSFSQQLTRGEMAEIIYRLQSNITSKPSQTDVILSSSGGTSSGTTGGSVQISNGGSGVAATFKISTPQDVVTFPNGMKVYIWIPSGTGSHPIDVFGSGCSGLFSYSTPNAQHSNFNKEIQTWVGLGLQHGYTVFAPDSFEFRGYKMFAAPITLKSAVWIEPMILSAF